LIQIDGVPLHVVDTAGLRTALDEVEKIGVERAWSEIQSADAVLFMHDLSRHDPDSQTEVAINYIAEDAGIGSAISQNGLKNTAVIDVWNKSDLASPAARERARDGVLISAKTGEGLEALRQKLLQVVGWQAAPEGLFMARERHVRALGQVKTELAKAGAQLQAAQPALDLLAEDLRQAQAHLGEITGVFSSDDLLGEIFSRFCIGK
jgi:tRNA modification GTPase